MGIFKVFTIVGNILAKAGHVTDEVGKLEGTDFSNMSQVETLQKLKPSLNKLLDLMEEVTGDKADKKLEEIREAINLF